MRCPFPPASYLHALINDPHIPFLRVATPRHTKVLWDRFSTQRGFRGDGTKGETYAWAAGHGDPYVSATRAEPIETATVWQCHSAPPRNDVIA